MMPPAAGSPQLGLVHNWRQFSLLVLVNAFVGAMVGLERSILPAIAEGAFHLAARGAILSFIAVFGVTKALTTQPPTRTCLRPMRSASRPAA